jgi:hypothetical protein
LLLEPGLSISYSPIILHSLPILLLRTAPDILFLPGLKIEIQWKAIKRPLRRIPLHT